METIRIFSLSNILLSLLLFFPLSSSFSYIPFSLFPPTFIFIYYLSPSSPSFSFSSSSSRFSISFLRTQNEFPSNSNHVFHLLRTILRHYFIHSSPFISSHNNLSPLRLSYWPHWLSAIHILKNHFCAPSVSLFVWIFRFAHDCVWRLVKNCSLSYPKDRGGKILRNVFTFLSKWTAFCPGKQNFHNN